MSNRIFSAADILLPRQIGDAAFAKTWSVIACDQFTSEPEYWEETANAVGDAPSTLRLILPEVYLSRDPSAALVKIAKAMAEYRQSVLEVLPGAMIYVQRRQRNGKIRSGVVGKIDLEAYCYDKGATPPVRATEGTVLSRIPPRVSVRRAATLELPHVLLLIDDAGKTVIEPLAAQTAKMQKLYDFDLLQEGGHITGYALPEEMQESLLLSLDALDRGGDTIRFAVGDGNHSLASAKARYMELKEQIGDRALTHPLRYALCEVENLYDDALEFEPIYRLVHTENPAALLEALAAYGKSCADGDQSVVAITDGERKEIPLCAGTHALIVGSLQNFLDDFLAAHPEATIDYIHGLDSMEKLTAAANTVGFVFDGMRKEDLFRAVEQSGALPRKTFSMGEARDKRYYLECREITE